MPKKATDAIDAYNLIREAYDATGFDEQQEIDPFQKQRMALKNLQEKHPSVGPKKRSSLEMLQNEMQYIPPTAALPPPPPVSSQVSVAPSDVSVSMVENKGTMLLGSPARGMTKNDLLGLLMKQQTLHKRESEDAFEKHQRRQATNQDEAFARHQRRQLENQERFQKMMFEHLKNCD